MKKNILLFKIIVCIFFVNNVYSQVGIGTTNPDASSLLEVFSTNKGVLLPRVALQSATDATTISNPANSLLVFNSGSTWGNANYYFNNGTTSAPAWKEINNGTIASNITDVDVTPHTQQPTIAKGASLKSFDGVNWEADVVEGFADLDVDFDTPWGISVFFSFTNQQFHIKNKSGTAIVGAIEYSYTRVDESTPTSNVVRRVLPKPFNNLAHTTIWGDNSLNFNDFGDFEKATVTFASSINAIATGNYIELEITAVVGSQFNNNFFRVKRLR